MKKLQVWLPLLFALVLIAGMWIGFKLRNNIPNSRGLFETAQRSSVQEVIDLVNNRYVDKVNSDSLTEDAIEAMLAHLDPHSIFIPAKYLDEVNEDLQGNFEGIGVEFFIINDTVNITNVLADGPSDKAGLKVGDQFLKVGDSTVAGKIDADRIKKLLRGPGGSQVPVTVLRNKQTVNTTITRGTIPLYSVDAAYMIDATTGYIHLNKFSGTTYEEFMQATENLQKKGMKQLIFDVRDNGGGILGEAVDIVDEFLNDNKLIVYTQGERQQRQEFRCKRPGLLEEGKVVLLVDENSASASEVVAGALQDWDRATLIGRRTFGKGLVQEQYDLSNGAALRLTVARYYSPLGRNIQKPYNKGRDAYHDEVAERFHNGEMLKGDTSTNHTGPSFKTPKGRTVYGGGGITPDIFIPFDTTGYSRPVYELFSKQTFGRFIYSYYIQHRDYFSQFKNAGDFAQRFDQQELAWNSLVAYAAKDSVQLAGVNSRDKQEVERRISTWLARQIWRMPGYFEVNNRNDTMVKRALEELKK
ncbi:S41 family peptidase [Paraflavitalea sp. CAU 1676]|uniref:S41 family peptidase n=1 Tax=Paraflavitalea sp. CAU 1676 TaxID=3032598 RepID=UPI0023DBEDE1|nr:S41 family peptidase [Paraflavitalea sp. CAU 1676]MDF2190036.1 S41 family peptidase [Paraflavitalea sp. CAU 1676]